MRQFLSTFTNLHRYPASFVDVFKRGIYCKDFQYITVCKVEIKHYATDEAFNQIHFELWI